MVDDELRLGIQAAQSGDFQQAQTYLMRVVQAKPASEEGWLWLGHCLRDPGKREYCYQKALALNPDNEPARRALIALQLSMPPAVQTNPPRQAAAQIPLKAQVKHKTKNTDKFLYIVLGLILILLVPAVPLTYMILTGNLNIYFPQLAQNLPMAYPPTATAYLSSTPTPLSPVPTPSRVPATATRSATIVAMQNSLEAEQYYNEAVADMRQLNCGAAIPLLDKAIALVTNNDQYYFQRATCYFSQTLFRSDLQGYQETLRKALADLNKAIAIKPAPDYFASRYEALVGFGDTTDLSADAHHFYQRATEDMAVAISWGQRGDAKRKLAASMIYGGQCQAGLLEAQKLIDQPGQDLGYIYYLESVAEACLGNPAQAIESVKRSDLKGGNERNINNMAIYLYQTGDSQQALEKLNQSIQQSPTYGGGRYFLRALIYYEMGKKDLAAQDLETGQGNTWGRGELLAYVNGKIYMDAGKKSQAIEAFQLAEASLPVYYTAMRSRIRKELADLGTGPLPETVSPQVIALAETLTGIDATLAPDVILGITPSPTAAPVGSTALEIRGDGSTRFIDYKGGYELSLPAGWLAFRLNAPEFYKITENEAQKNELLRKLMELYQSDDPSQYRLYAAFPTAQEKDSRDLASIDVQRFSDNLPIEQALRAAVQNLKKDGFTVSRNEIVDTSSGMTVGVTEYESTGKSALTGEVLTFVYKIYIIKTDKGLVTISMTGIEPLKDLLFAEIDKVLETVKLLHQD